MAPPMKPSREEMLAVTMNQKLAKQGAKTRKLAEARDVNTMPDPKTYAAVMGMLGTRPDEMGFSVAHPQYKEIMAVAEPAFVAGTAAQLAPFAKPAAAGVKATGRAAGQALNDRLLSGQSLTPGLNTPAPISFVVKPKGGNWLTGDVEKQVGKMKMADWTTPEEMAELQSSIDAAKRIMGNDPTVQRTIAQMENELSVAKRNNAINSWIDSNLTNYIKKEMATPDDPVRKLAEQGITHKSDLDNYRTSAGAVVQMRRRKAGFPEEGMGQSDLAKKWENLADYAARSKTAQQYTDPDAMENIVPMYRQLQVETNLRDYPWLSKVDPETNIYQFARDDVGFDHIVDVLRQDVREGRIRPEQLSKVSMEQAVRRTYEYDQEMAKKMREAAIKQTEGMPVHKEYPEGYRWVELAPPKELPAGYSVVKDDMTGSFKVVDASGKDAVKRPENQMGHINVPFHKTEESAIAEAMKYDKRLEDALKYEGETMGHCVGGYCPDVLEGRSRIYSLRDAKGEPHVTVEVQPSATLTPEKRAAQIESLMHRMRGEGMSEEAAMRQVEKLYPESETFSRIVQIKGKQNRAPNEQYLPYVQDFVKGGQWSDVGDLQNTGLKHISKVPEANRFKEVGIDVPTYVTDKEHDELIYEYLKRTSPQPDYDFMSKEYGFPPPEGMKAGGEVKMDNGGSIKATPVKNKQALGMSKALQAVHGFASKPFGYNNPPGEMISEFLGIPATARTLERMGYGEPQTTGKGMTTKPRDDLMDALMSVAPLAPATKGAPVGMMFIGQKSKRWDQAMADLAAKMEKAGADPAEIWQKTGTFRGADGHLRQEISDQGATLLSKDDRNARVESIKKDIAEKQRQIAPTPQKDLFPKLLTEAKKDVRDDIGVLKGTVKHYNRNARTQGVYAPFIFEHPELYKAYPELNNLKITTEGGSGNTLGALSVTPSRGFYPGSMEIDIYDRGLKRDPNSTALHELQHAIQTIEGWSPGGNPTMAFTDLRAHDMLKKRLDELKRPSTFEEFQKANRFPDDKAKEAYDEYLRTHKSFVTPSIERELQKDVAMEFYRRLAGEAEARATQDRMNMGMTERRQTPPPASYDYPQEDLFTKPPMEYKAGGEVKMGVGGLLGKASKAAKAAKGAENVVVPAAPTIVIPSKISNVKEAIRESKGDFGARRVERAADEIPNLEKLYKEEALRQAFGGDNARAVMTMNPADFEKYAKGLSKRTKADIGPKMAELAKKGEIDKHTLTTDEYIQYLRGLTEGFDDVPFLSIDKEEFGLPLKPFISGHEGRHRSRALAESGQPTSLVRLFPSAELREPLPRRSQEEYIQALRDELELTGNLVLPEGRTGPAVVLPDIYAKGGEVKMGKGGNPSKKKAIDDFWAGMKEAVPPANDLGPLDTLKQNLSAAYEGAKKIPGNLYNLATDPAGYVKNLPAPTGQQIMDAFGPGNVGAGFMGSYRPHTPLKPDPEVGTRYKVQDMGGLAPRKELDIEKIQGSQAKIFPWDATHRNKLVTEVSEVPLTKPVLTEGGDEYMLDVNHIKNRIAGASNEGIANRIQDRINQASWENLNLGGTGKVYGFPSRMGEGAEFFSTFPADIAMDLLKQGALNKKELAALTKDIRTMKFEGKDAPFAGAAPVGTPEFEAQLRTGIPKSQGKKGQEIPGATAGNLRKGLMDRLGMVGYQKRLGYNLPDLQGAVLAENLKGVPKGYVGNVAAELDPGAALRPSKSSSYSTDFSGQYAGSMANMPVEFLMPNTYELIYRQMREKYPKDKYPKLTPESFRNMTIGAMEKRKENISEMIGQRSIDAVKTYQEGLKKGEFNPNNIQEVYDYMRRKKLDLKLKSGGAVQTKSGLLKVKRKK